MTLGCRIIVVISLILLTIQWQLPKIESQPTQMAFSPDLMTSALDRSFKGQLFQKYIPDERTQAYDPSSMFVGSPSNKMTNQPQQQEMYIPDAPPPSIQGGEWMTIRQDKPSVRAIKHRRRQDESTVMIKNDMKTVKKQERQGITSTQKKLFSRIAAAGVSLQPRMTNYDLPAAQKVTVAEEIKIRRADLKESARKKNQNVPAGQNGPTEAQTDKTTENQQIMQAPPKNKASLIKIKKQSQNPISAARTPVKKPQPKLKVQQKPPKPQEPTPKPQQPKMKPLPSNQLPQEQDQTPPGYYKVQKEDGSYYLIPASNNSNQQSNSRQYIILP